MRVRAFAMGALVVGGMAVPAMAQEPVNVRRAVSATGLMEVHLISGEVRLVGWNRSDLQVTGTLGGEAERLDVSTEGSTLVVRVVYPRGQQHTRGRGADLEIHYPARRTLQVQSVSADVGIEHAAGRVQTTTMSGNIDVSGNPPELEVNSRSGDMQLDGSTGRLQANSISGNVQVNGDVRGEVQVNTVSGDIQMRGAAGSFSAHSVSGNIEAGSVGNSAEAQTVSGDIQISARTLTGEYSTVTGGITLSGRPGTGRTLEVHSHSGEVLLRLPRGVGADAEITTWSGEISVDIDHARTLQAGRREREVRIGSGGPRVELSTFSGSVRIVEQ
jgi:DUF4097 and DUF4098 domain-containing protein YvlB